MEEQKMCGQGMKASCNFSELKNSRSVFAVALLLLLACILSACASGSSANTSVDSQGQVTVTSRQTPASSSVKSQPTSANQAGARTTASYPVKVYFSRLPQSMSDSSAVFPVERISPTSSVSTFAMDQLASGPTAAESASGYVSEVKSHLSGPSICPPSAPNTDFMLSLNTKGVTSEPGTATLKFCRVMTSAGIGTDARASAEINATLKQFPEIKKVIILTKDAHCFGDESGADMCMR